MIYIGKLEWPEERGPITFWDRDDEYETET